jgi:Secretion system C-terminal sorting domain
LAATCIAPNTQASNFSFSNVAQTTATVNWTNGNGAGRVVYINTTNSFTPPANGANPTANTAYAGGQQCIFNGTGSGPVNVTGLAASTQYFVRVYEYCSPDWNYNTTSSVNNPGVFTTTANTQPQLMLQPDSLSGFSYIVGSGPSSMQTYTLSGSNLTGAGNLVVSASNAFEISTDGQNFSALSLVPFGNGVVTGQPFTLFVRLKAGLGVGLYPFELQTHNGGGASVNLVCSGEVKGTSSISTSETIDWSLYPNPIRHVLHVSLGKGDYELVWTTLLGKVVRVEEQKVNDQTEELTFSRGQLSSGVYLLVIREKQSGKMGVERLIYVD